MRDVSQQMTRMAFPRGGNFPAHQFFHRERVGDVVRQRREVIEPVRVRNELIVLHVLGDFFVAAMQKTDVRRRFGDDLAVEFENEPQHAVRRRMRWPHVEHHFFANVVAGFRRAISRPPPTTRVTGSGDSISRVVKAIIGRSVYARKRSVLTAQAQTWQFARKITSSRLRSPVWH